MTARDFAMARLAVALKTSMAMQASIAEVIDEFDSPSSDASAETRADDIEDLMGLCHDLLSSLQLAHNATAALEPEEVAMSEDDLQEDGEDDGESDDESAGD